MAWNDSPYALPISTMGTYKPSTDYSSLKGEDPYRYSNTYTPKKASTGFNKASALNPNGTTRTAVTNSAPITPDVGLASTLSQVPTYAAIQPSFLDRFQSTFTGTSPFKYDTGVTKDNRIGYIDEFGKQAYTGELAEYDANGNRTGLNTAALDAANTLGSNAFGTAAQTGTGLAGVLSGAWDTIGGSKGFADLAGGLGALGSLYTGYKQNKMAEQEHNARMGELARQRQRDADWQRDIKASGLGSYSAGMGGK